MLAVFGVSAALLAVGSTTTSAKAACGNEGIRVEQGSQGLADCRAWEKVSPADKNDSDALFGITRAAPDGGLYWTSFAAFAGAPAADGGAYVSRREGPGTWQTNSIVPPFGPQGPLHQLPSTYAGMSADLSHGVLMTTPPGAPLSSNPAEPLGFQNLYVRDLPAGGYQLVTNQPSTNHEVPPQYIGSSSDYTRNFFESIGPAYVPGAPPFSLYEQHGADLSIASILPGGEVAPGGADPGGNTFARSVSDDGSRIFFTAPHSGTLESVGPLYMRSAGATTEISRPEAGVVDPEGPRPAQFLTASLDGSVAVFSSCEKLTANATAAANGAERCLDGQGASSDLYRFDAETGTLTDLTTTDPTGAGVLGVLGASEDADRIYFAATGDLATGATAGEPNIYVWTASGGVDFIATVSPSDTSDWATPGTFLKGSRVNTTGSVVAFTSSAPAPGYPNNGFAEVYRYVLGAAAPECVSCRADGLPATAPSTIAGQVFSNATSSFPDFEKQNLTADGRTVFFETAEPLVDQDVNGRIDVYSFEAGGAGLSLISSGRSPEPSSFVGASTSGIDAYFATRERLLRSDRDQLVDIYDARIDGGAAEPPPTQPPCGGESCQGTPTVPPAGEVPVSSRLMGPKNPSLPAKSKPKKKKSRACVKTRAKKSKRRAKKCTKGKQGKQHRSKGMNK
jgi:hypothetical protein